MIKAIISILLLPVIVFAEVNFDQNKGNIKNIMNDIILPTPSTQTEAIKTTKEWTIMVYLNAKNDLERFGIIDMNEMEKVGSNNYFNIVVQFGRIKGYDSSNGDWSGVRRYYITKDDDSNIINSQVIENLGEVDMGDYKTLVDFAKWAKKKYPAKKYMLVIWNHGTGWEKGMKTTITKGVSYDEATGNHINTPQLGLAMKEIGKVDVINFDACLMQMIEVSYEIKDYATYIVASEEVEPVDGDSYDGYLTKLAANPTMGPLELSKAVVNAYYEYYSQKGQGTTKSVIRAEKLNDLLSSVNNFAYTLSELGDKNLIKNAASQAQKFEISDNKDLYHFAKLISSNTSNQQLKEKAQNLMDVIKNKVVAYNKTTNGGWSWWGGSTDYSNAYGIAIYIPSYSIGAGYTELKWSKYSNWDEFLKWYISGGSASTSTTQKSIIELEEYYHPWQ